MSLPTFIYPISYTLIDTFLVVFIKATSVNGHTSYNSITVNAITEIIKLGIAIYIAHSEGSLHTLRQIVTNPGLMIRFAIPNLMYAVNNNLFHYSVSALPPAVFVVAINAFRTVITALLQPCVSNQALTRRQIVACFLLMLSFVCASLPEVIKAAFAGTMKGSTFELLLYLASTYSIISVVASLSQEKLLKDSKSLMVANIINYSIGICFQVSGMIYEKTTHPETDLFRGLDVFWVRAIPCLMAVVGLSISYVLKYYDNIVKLLCSSVSVLLVNSATSMMSGDSLINVYFFLGWLLTFPATYLYYIAPNAPSSPEAAGYKPLSTKADATANGTMGDEVAENSHRDEDVIAVDAHVGNVDSEEEAKKALLQNAASQRLEDEKKARGTAPTGWTRDKTLVGSVVGIMLVTSILTSTFELDDKEKKQPHQQQSMKTAPAPGSTWHPLLPWHSTAYDGLESLDETCSLFEVPATDMRSNLRGIDSYSPVYSSQYTTVDYLTGDVYASCAKDLFLLGPDSQEYHQLRRAQPPTPDHRGGPKNPVEEWLRVDAGALVQPADYNAVHSLLALQQQHRSTETSSEDPTSVAESSRHLLLAGQYRQLPWTYIDQTVGKGAMYFWLWCSDQVDANLVTRPPVLQKTQLPPQMPLSARHQQDVQDYLEHLSFSVDGANNHDKNSKLSKKAKKKMKKLQKKKQQQAQRRKDGKEEDEEGSTNSDGDDDGEDAKKDNEKVSSIGVASTSTTGESPIFDTVLVLYLDAVSRSKFHHFFRHSQKVLDELLHETSPLHESSNPLDATIDASTAATPTTATTSSLPPNQPVDSLVSSSRSTSISGPNSNYVHTAIELEHYHAVGINSVRNYPQLLSGVSTYDTNRFFHKSPRSVPAVSTNANASATAGAIATTSGSGSGSHLRDVAHRREPWLFDLAENKGFLISAGVSNCPGRCHSQCHDQFTHGTSYEIGGFHAQYLAETPLSATTSSASDLQKDPSAGRLPAAYHYPLASYCEAQYRPALIGKSCAACHATSSASTQSSRDVDGHAMKTGVPEMTRPNWIGNKLGMAHVLDWWRVWLASTAAPPVTSSASSSDQTNAKKKQPRFGVIVFEETHQQEFVEQIDLELARFLTDLLTQRTLFGTQQLAMVILADHGLHFTSEFRVPSGKIANKQPFNYLIMPKNYLVAHPQETVHLLHNSKALTTPYDVRATLQYWLSGRDWSATRLQEHLHRQQLLQHSNLFSNGSQSVGPHSLSSASHAQHQPQTLQTALMHQVFASRHGDNLLTQQLPYNRTCVQAGVPADFCGCNLQPCRPRVKRQVKATKQAIVDYINGRILAALPPAPSHSASKEDQRTYHKHKAALLQVCRPLQLSEVIFVPGLDDCLGSASTVVVNAYLQRKLRLLSITYLVGAAEISDDADSSDGESEHSSTNAVVSKDKLPSKKKVSSSALHLHNVNTISNYGKIWRSCLTQFAALNLTQSHHIPDGDQQFCLCDQESTWLSWGAGVINAINF